MEMIQRVVKDMNNVKVMRFSGLVVDFARQVSASVIIRGLRAVSDFEYEFQMALMNRKQEPKIDTVFLMPDEKYTYLSSSIVREVAQHGGKIECFVPTVVKEMLANKFAKWNIELFYGENSFLYRAINQPTHIYKHNVNKVEVEQALEYSGEDRTGKDGARVAIERTAERRFLRVIYMPDSADGGIFMITAYELKGKPLVTYRRRISKKGLIKLGNCKVLDLLTDGKADALVRRILCLVFGGRGRPPCHGLNFLD